MRRPGNTSSRNSDDGRTEIQREPLSGESLQFIFWKEVLTVEESYSRQTQISPRQISWKNLRHWLPPLHSFRNEFGLFTLTATPRKRAKEKGDRIRFMFLAGCVLFSFSFLPDLPEYHQRQSISPSISQNISRSDSNSSS